MTSDKANITSGAILRESVEIFARNWPILLLAGAAEGLIQIGQNAENRERLGGAVGVLLFALATLAITIAVQGIAARIVFVREAIADASVPARFGAFVGTSLLVLLGIGLGFILLIVPGVILALRWALAAHFTVARDMGISEAMKTSVTETEGHRGEIFGAYVVFGLATYGPYALLIPVAGSLNAITSADLLSVFGIIRVAWEVFAATANLALGIGIFSTLVGRHNRLHEVFA